MVEYSYHFHTNRYVGNALVAAATCLTVYLAVIRPALTTKPKPETITRARTRAEALAATSEKTLPYPPDAFPGARDVVTEYGTIKVFEWGPEAGEKVVLVHGIGTPCVALGEMAREFVRRGCRVLLFGK